jgi:CheY-like chemotaxis protein
MTVPKVRVLIVEDEAIVSMDLRYHLMALGYCVAAGICSGKEAVEAASQLLPDVVLINVRLSGELDGIGAAAEIRRRFNVPVVYLTGSLDQAELQRAKATDPSGFLFKPFDYPEIE